MVVSELTCIGEGELVIEAAEYVLVSAAVTPGTSSTVTVGSTECIFMAAVSLVGLVDA